MAVHIPGVEVFIRHSGGQHAGHMRPGTYQGHLSSHHVDELRQFIEIALAQEGADQCDARIVGNGLRNPGAVALVGIHRPELENGKLPAIQTVAPLTEKHRSAACQFYCNRDCNK